jgi:hypothetical protein
MTPDSSGQWSAAIGPAQLRSGRKEGGSHPLGQGHRSGGQQGALFPPRLEPGARSQRGQVSTVPGMALARPQLVQETECELESGA